MKLISKDKLIGMFVVISGLFISGCVTDTILTDTAGSETVNTYTLMVVNDDRKPLDGALVRLISDDTWLEKISNKKDVVSYTALSDSAGVVKIPHDTLSNGKKVNVLADSGTSSVFLPEHEFIDGNGQDTIVLSKALKLKGKMVTSDTLPDSLRLYGTDYIASVNSLTGEFDFGSVPQGEYKVIASVNESETSVSCAEIEKIDIRENLEGIEIKVGDIPEPDPVFDTTGFGVKFEVDNGVLIDNFDMKMDLMNYLSFSDWYLTKGGTMQLHFPTERETDTMYVPPKSAMISDEAYEGKSVHMEFSSNEGPDYYLIMGAQITHRGVGFTNVDTISFWAKGDGAVAVRLHGEENDYMPKATSTVNLTSEWKEYFVTSRRFRAFESDGSESDWETVRHRMFWIAFDFEDDGTEVWIDNVMLRGVTLRDLMPQ